MGRVGVGHRRTVCDVGPTRRAGAARMLRPVRVGTVVGHIVVGSEWMLAGSFDVWRLRTLEPVAWARVRSEQPLRTGACVALKTEAGAWLWARVQGCLAVEGEPYVVELGLLTVPAEHLMGGVLLLPPVVPMSQRAE